MSAPSKDRVVRDSPKIGTVGKNAVRRAVQKLAESTARREAVTYQAAPVLRRAR